MLYLHVAYLDLGFDMLFALHGFMCVGLLAYVVASTPLVAYWITCEIHLYGVGVVETHLSLLCAMLICMPCLLYATCLAFFASLHLCMLSYMFMH